MGGNGLQVLFNSMLRMEINGRKVCMEYVGEFGDVGRQGEFGASGSNQFYKYPS